MSGWSLGDLTLRHWGFLLALLPIWLGALGGRRWLQRRRRSFPVARMAMARRLVAERVVYRLLVAAPRALRTGALTLLVLALARPQAPGDTVVSGEGIAIIFALDMSGSMNAVDLPEEQIEAHHARGEEPPNRFDVARDLLRRFVTSRREDRIGLVVFGKHAYLHFPATLDYRLIMEQLQSLVLDDSRRDRRGFCLNGCTLDGSGTAIGDALARAYRRLRKSKAKSRVIVLITDGKNEGGSIDPDTITRELAQLPEADRVKVYTILVGDPALTRLPVIDPFTSELARDEEGRLVYRPPGRVYPTRPDLLRRIAERTGGEFWESPDEDAFRTAFAELQRTLFKREIREPDRELFHIPLLAGLALLVLEGLLAGLLLRRTP